MTALEDKNMQPLKAVKEKDSTQFLNFQSQTLINEMNTSRSLGKPID
jgi:hypothetical protein